MKLNAICIGKDPIEWDYTNIDLGKKCLKVLNHDLEGINQDINDLDDKISKKLKHIKNLQREDKKMDKIDKPFDEMTLYELEAEEERLRIRISTANLNKQQET